MIESIGMAVHGIHLSLCVALSGFWWWQTAGMVKGLLQLSDLWLFMVWVWAIIGLVLIFFMVYACRTLNHAIVQTMRRAMTPSALEQGQEEAAVVAERRRWSSLTFSRLLSWQRLSTVIEEDPNYASKQASSACHSGSSSALGVSGAWRFDPENWLRPQDGHPSPAATMDSVTLSGESSIPDISDISPGGGGTSNRTLAAVRAATEFPKQILLGFLVGIFGAAIKGYIKSPISLGSVLLHLLGITTTKFSMWVLNLLCLMYVDKPSRELVSCLWGKRSVVRPK